VICFRKPSSTPMPNEIKNSVTAVPIVYTVRGCQSCVKLLEKWKAEGVDYDERRVDLSQTVLDEARHFGSLVPIVVWPDGRVEQGFGDSLGCFI
jgi:glutaredoxin